MLLLPLILAMACRSDDTRKDSATPDDTALPADWPPYDLFPDWTSTDHGYDTGGAWADIDGDGRLDLVVAQGNDMEPGPLRVWYANSDGSLPEAASWRSDTEAHHGHLATGDVDGDGDVDVVVALYLGKGGFDEPGGVALYRNEGAELPADPSWSSSDPFFSFSVALGDVDLDGDLDLAVATGEPYEHGPEPDRLYLNEGGSFAEPPAWQSEASFSLDTAFVDVDGDGALDLVFARVGSPHALYRNEGGLPTPKPAWEAEGSTFEGNSLDFGDVDGDGLPDLVISDNAAGRYTLHCGPDLRLCWQNEDFALNPSAVALLDLDGDDDLDLAAGGWWAPLRFYRNTRELGLGLETEASLVTDEDTVAEALAFHDTDGLDVDDIVLQSDTSLLPIPRPCVVVQSSPPGAVGDGYISVAGKGPVTAVCRCTPHPDLLVTDWTRDQGNHLFLHRGRAAP